jgi:methionyl aminopeptidase
VFRRHPLKSPAELRAMIPAGEATAAALAAVRQRLVVGATPLELDAVADAVIRGRGGRSNFRLVPGYDHTLCVSVGSDVVHGIPDDRAFAAGDLVSIDGGAEVGGWNGDAAFTVVLPDPARPDVVAARQALVEAAERALWAGIARLASTRHLNEVGEAIEESVAASGPYSIIEGYGGHGIGREMHEEPQVLNFGRASTGMTLREGMVFTIEPMINQGTRKVSTEDDGWTVVTDDGRLSAQFEHTVAVTRDGVEVLTLRGDERARGMA